MTIRVKYSTVTLISFRVECERDIERILQHGRMVGIEIEVTEKKPDDHGRPDIDVEMEISVSLGNFKASLQGNIDDIHVALETMRAVPLSENPLTRQS